MAYNEPLALPAINTILQYGNGASPETFVTIAFLNNLSGPSIEGQVVDVTSMSSVLPWRQKIVTLLAGGEISADAFWQPMDPTHQSLLTFFSDRGQGQAGVPIDFRMVFPDYDGTVYAFSGFVSACKITAPVADVIKAAVTITITGPVSGPGFVS